MLHTETDLVRLDDTAGCTPARVGGKAHHLAQLLAAGFPVPEGVVVTTSALARQAQGAATGFPDDLRSTLERAVARLGWPVAVRSSGVAEDLADASYAGLYETVLDVADTDALVDAVLRCRASASAARVRNYRPAHDGGAGAGMAVLVQRMVAADAAGVAFTANPVTGDRDQAVIDAVPGLGDRLVSGETDAERWSVRANEAVLQGDGKAALTAGQALAVAHLARRVAAHFGQPQDVEWAIADGAVHVLQARPITALPAPPVLPVPVPAVPPEGYWVREASHAPRAWSPLASSLGYEARNAALRDDMAEFGLLVDAVEFTEIGGWEYMRLVPLGGKDRPAPPSWLMPLLVRAVPTLRRRVRRSVEAVRADVAVGLIDRWYDQWRPQLSARSAQLRGVDLDSLSDAELAAHWDAVVDNLHEGARVHFTVHGATCFPLARLVFTAQELLGWDEATTLRLLAGLSDMSTEPGRRLQALADAVAADPDKRRVLGGGGPEALERLRALDPGFVAAFDAYLEEFGMLALSYDPATPSLAERPELALGLLADQVARGFDAGS
jgi:pyruvate,water dikinase